MPALFHIREPIVKDCLQFMCVHQLDYFFNFRIKASGLPFIRSFGIRSSRAVLKAVSDIALKHVEEIDEIFVGA